MGNNDDGDGDDDLVDIENQRKITACEVKIGASEGQPASTCAATKKFSNLQNEIES